MELYSYGNIELLTSTWKYPNNSMYELYNGETHCYKPCYELNVLALGANLMLLEKYYVESILIFLSVDIFGQVVTNLPYRHIITSYLPLYAIVYLPKSLIPYWNKLYPDKL